MLWENVSDARGNPDFYKLHPHFCRFHDIPPFTPDSIFIIKFCNSVRVFRIAPLCYSYAANKLAIRPPFPPPTCVWFVVFQSTSSDSLIFSDILHQTLIWFCSMAYHLWAGKENKEGIMKLYSNHIELNCKNIWVSACSALLFMPSLCSLSVEHLRKVY